VENGAEDVFLSVSRKNALDLTKEENEFLLRNFFSAYAPTMILRSRGTPTSSRTRSGGFAPWEGKNGGPGGYGASEYTDLRHPVQSDLVPSALQGWGPGTLPVCGAREAGSRSGRKQYVLDHQIRVMGQVFDEYRKLSGKTGRAFLLPDVPPDPPAPHRQSFRARRPPGAALPGLPFSWPADARTQLERGKGVFHDLFGSDPAGLCPRRDPSARRPRMAAETGFRWAATDEILLARAFSKQVRRIRKEFLSSRTGFIVPTRR